MSIEGYKIFNSDWTCRNKQYSCPGYFEEDVVPKVCVRGIHFFTDIEAYLKLYPLRKDMRIAKVIAIGDIDKGLFTVRCTNKIFIVEEIPIEVVMEKLNPGGGSNMGINNFGVKNYGKNNIGNNNYGNNNIGDGNKGHYNVGSLNTGNHNTGNYNIGYDNSGNCNIGNNNTGNCNKTSYSTGYFNTEEQPIYMFNKPTKLRPFMIHELEGMELVQRLMTCYDLYSYYNKNTIYSSYCKKLRNKAWHCTFTEKQKEAVLSLPNFDAEIFKEITGIDIDMEVQDIWNLI